MVESVGPETLARSIAAAGTDAQIALMGAFGGSGAAIDPRALNRRLVTIRRIAVGSRAAFEAMNRAIALHALCPIDDRAFPFAEARDAYRYFAARRHIGKVVIGGA